MSIRKTLLITGSVLITAGFLLAFFAQNIAEYWYGQYYGCCPDLTLLFWGIGIAGVGLVPLIVSRDYR
jgi:hypothetical protein